MKLKVGISVILLGITSFLADAGSEMMKPILPMFIVSLGGAGAAIGIIGGLGESIPNFLQIPCGYVSDKIGRRKVFVIGGYATSAISKFLLSLSTSWRHVLLLFPLERSGKGIRTSPRDALITETTPGPRGIAFGVHRTMDTAGAIVGSLLAFILVLGGMDLRLMLVIAALISSLSLIPIFLVKEVRGRKEVLISIRELPPHFFHYVAIAGIFSLANFTYMFFLLRAGGMYTGKEAIAIPLLLYVWFNVIYAAFSTPCGALSDKIGRRKTLLLGYLVFSMGCAGFAISNSLMHLIIFFGLYGLSYAFIEGVGRAFASEFVTQKLRATALGVYHTVNGISVLAGSIVAGILWSIDPRYPFAYGAVLSLLASLLFLRFKVEKGMLTQPSSPQ